MLYECPMHAEIRDTRPGRCPKCRMPLIPEGARFGLLRQVLSNRLHLAVMLALMLALMAAAMALR